MFPRPQLNRKQITIIQTENVFLLHVYQPAMVRGIVTYITFLERGGGGGVEEEKNGHELNTNSTDGERKLIYF